MPQPKLTGIGCFAKPETLNRLFKKVLADFIPDQDCLVNPVAGQALEHFGVLRLVRDFVAAPTDEGRFPELQAMKCKHITGFFVSVTGCRLAISIFARDNWRRQHVFTAEMDRRSVLRKRRSN